MSDWRDRIISANKAAALVRAGNTLFVGTACATPQTLVEALRQLAAPPPGVQLVYFIADGLIKGEDDPICRNYRHRMFFVGTQAVHLAAHGRAEYIPISLTEIPFLLENGQLDIDIAFVQTTVPDRFGQVSLGISVDITSSMVRHAKTVVAEVNPKMPRTFGDSFVSVDNIHYFVEVDTPLFELRRPPVREEAKKISQYIAGIVDHGSTLQIGLGRVPNEMLGHLTSRRNLGIHSDVITDSVIELIANGVINGREKSAYPGKIVTSYCVGTQALYDLVDSNPMFLFQPIETVCDPAVICQNSKMVSITQAFAIDLTGQVCVDQFDGKFYGGVSTQVNFIRGAARSRGGKPIICLTSIDENGNSRIRSTLGAGEAAAIPRSDVHYVVTEFGIAYLFGKSIGERVMAIIEITHPKFRESLLEDAVKLGYVQPGLHIAAGSAYQIEEETEHVLRSQKTVKIRPAKASDIEVVRNLFYRLSEDDIYTRFFRRLRTLSDHEFQSMCNVNYDSEVAFLAVVGPREHELVVGSCCYYLDRASNMAEAAFMIAPDWQSEGLGKIFMKKMRDYAVTRGIKGFTTEILPSNRKMIALAKSGGDNVSVTHDEDCCHIVITF